MHPPDQLDRLLRLARQPRRTVARMLARRPSARSATAWCRVEMERSIDEFIVALGPSTRSAVEISGRGIIDRHTWREAVRLEYPAFDLCNPGPIERRFDVVICNQVLEHVVDPWEATRTLARLCTPGGVVIVATPFLLRLHREPLDLWRFSEDGLARMLRSAGLADVETHAWGNAACIRANLHRWAPAAPWRSLRNEPDLPVVVWAFARSAAASDESEVVSMSRIAP